MAPDTLVAATESQSKDEISKELREKANDFLNSRRHANNLVNIIAHLKLCVEQKLPINPSILTLEVIFTELLVRREMCVAVIPLKPKDDSPESKYREWLLARFEEALALILNCIEAEKIQEATQALRTCMNLLATEGKYPIDINDVNVFPMQRLRVILQKLISLTKPQAAVMHRFRKYAEYLDIVVNSWKLMQQLATRKLFANEAFALNYMELMNMLPVTKNLQLEKKFFCSMDLEQSNLYDYNVTRRYINKVWCCLMQWTDGMHESVHRQVLIVLLERVLPHLDNPILLTDFLMDSLDCGGSVSLLAFQGVFTLIQKHNITYPNIYEKLYSMFEPEIFTTKYKARLFYLADIFLCSTHLPESLVAAFVKRLARLCLIASPPDVVIILYFIGNLIVRHSGLKRLICAHAAMEVPRDPFIMEEREPTKSCAIESSLWEIIILQQHAVPDIATAARFISQPLPTTEWDLSTVLELKDDDVFDQEISKKTKQYALAFERPQNLFLASNDKVVQYWKLF